MDDASVGAGGLSMPGMKNDFDAEYFSRVVRSFLRGHPTSFHSERVFGVCL